MNFVVKELLKLCSAVELNEAFAVGPPSYPTSNPTVVERFVPASMVRWSLVENSCASVCCRVLVTCLVSATVLSVP